MILQWNEAFDGAQMLWILIASILMVTLLLPAAMGLFSSGCISGLKKISVQQWISGAALHSMLWLLIFHSLAFGPSMGTTPKGETSGPPKPMSEMMNDPANKTDNRVLFGRGGFVGDLQFSAFANLEAQGDPESPIFASRRPHHSISLSAFVVLQLSIYLCAVAALSAAVVASLPEIAAPQLLVVSLLWGVLVYVPVAHWVWGDGWLAIRFALDSGGGLFVLLLAVSAIVIRWNRSEGFATVDASARDNLEAASHGLWWLVFPLLMCAINVPSPQLRSLMLINAFAGATGGFFFFFVMNQIVKPQEYDRSPLPGLVAGLAAAAPGAMLFEPMTSLLAGVAGAVIGMGLWTVVRRKPAATGLRTAVLAAGASVAGLLAVGCVAGSSNGILHWDRSHIESMIHGQNRLIIVQSVTAAAVVAWVAVVTIILRLCFLRRSAQ
ncbi:MAG: hypothetical protein U0996_20215 [Planctomycetaceae bacterium]